MNGLVSRPELAERLFERLIANEALLQGIEPQLDFYTYKASKLKDATSQAIEEGVDQILYTQSFTENNFAQTVLDTRLSEHQILEAELASAVLRRVDALTRGEVIATDTMSARVRALSPQKWDCCITSSFTGRSRVQANYANRGTELEGPVVYCSTRRLGYLIIQTAKNKNLHIPRLINSEKQPLVSVGFFLPADSSGLIDHL